MRAVEARIAEVVRRGRASGKSTGFTIGNTAKTAVGGAYLTPLRETSLLVASGIIVYSEDQAARAARAADGRVDYVLVDAEKKIPNPSARGRLANVERVVRENVRDSRLWVYKANDLSVEAVDGFLAQLTRRDLRGLGGRRTAILGAGNIGFKLALRLVERGAEVVITRRRADLLELYVRALNAVKPAYTEARVRGTTDNVAAVRGAEILVGTTPGTPLVTPEMIDLLAEGAIIIDVGKGVLFPEAVRRAAERSLPVYRLDVTAAFEGLIHHLRAVEDLLERRHGRRDFHGIPVVSGGLLGREHEWVVDNVWDPRVVYGLADGRGDFLRDLSPRHREELERFRRLMARGREVRTADRRPVEEASLRRGEG